MKIKYFEVDMLKDRLRPAMSYTIPCLIAAGITALLYLPSLRNGFVNWDDGFLIYDNSNIRSIDTDLFRSLLSPEMNPTALPLTLFSYALDYAAWGLEPFGFHLVNVVLHTLNTVLVFTLATRVLRIKGGNKKTTLTTSFVTALLFGIHPLNSEPVNWVVGRSDLLSAFFFLSALLSYVRYCEGGYCRALYGAVLFLFAMALMSKPTAVSLPAIMLIMDIYLFKRISFDGGIKGLKVAIIEKAPFFLLSFLAVAMTVLLRLLAEKVMQLQDIPLWSRILITGRSFMFYLYKMLFPFNLSPYYPYPSDIEALSAEYGGALMSLLLITFFCIRRYKKHSLYLPLWLFYLTALSPMVIPLMGFYKIGTYAEADRYAYIASIAPFFLIGLGAAKTADFGMNKHLKAFIPILCLIFAFFAAGTLRREALWHDSVTLWSHAIKFFPSGATYANRGNAYIEAGNYNKAIDDLDIAIGLNPLNAEAYFDRGSAYQELGNYQLAIQNYNKAIDLKPGYSKAYNNRGIANFDSGDYVQAVRDFSSAIGLDPENAFAHNNRAMVYLNLGRYAEALSDAERAISLYPQYAEAYYNRGGIYLKIGEISQAVKDFNKAIEIDPRHADAYYILGEISSKVGKSEEAAVYFNKATALGIKHKIGGEGNKNLNR